MNTEIFGIYRVVTLVFCIRLANFIVSAVILHTTEHHRAEDSMFTNLVVAIALISTCLPVAAQSDKADVSNTETGTAKVDAIFSTWNKPDSPGCALGVIKDGKLVYKRGYGSANLDYNVPISSESVFYIASTSKQFTAASILLLARRGTISLDDDIRKYFPEVPKYDAPITIRNLIHHTSGIRDYLELRSMAGKSSEDEFNNDDAIEIIARQKALNFKPGDEHLYSNSNYVLLAEIIRRASGKSLRQFAEENIFRPLDMRNTHFNDNRTMVIKNRVVSYGPTAEGQFRYFIKNINAMGDGNLLTTVEDLARWDQNFYDNRVGGSGFAEQMLTRGKLNTGKELSYAFGLVHGEYHGFKTVSHGGGFLGFRTEMVRFPDYKLTVICLCNSGLINPGRLVNQVADLYLPQPANAAPQTGRPAALAAPPSRVDTQSSEKPTGLNAEQLGEFAGTYYADELDATYSLVVNEGKLQVKSMKLVRGTLSPAKKDEFTGIGTRYIFRRDIQGRVEGFTLNAGRVRGILFTKRVP